MKAKRKRISQVDFRTSAMGESREKAALIGGSTVWMLAGARTCVTHCDNPAHNVGCAPGTSQGYSPSFPEDDCSGQEDGRVFKDSTTV